MKLFNIDLHVSVIGDMKNIFADLGHEVEDWSLSGHAWVFGRERSNIDVINHNNWRLIDKNMADSFYNRYKDELDKYDAFVVTHTPCFSMLYERFNKPIIVVCSTRYEEPFSSDMIKWKKFNNFLIDGVDKGRIKLIANNKYDKKYTETFLDRRVELIPSLCEYTKAAYTGINKKFLYSSKYKTKIDLPRDVSLVDKDLELGPGYSWQDLFSYSGIVHIPYNASTMSIFEQYTANVPLFFPTMKFLTDLRSKNYDKGVMSELSWNQVFQLPPGSIIGPMYEDPNNYLNNQVLMKWAELSDFYDQESMPHIQYFDSFEHLGHILRKTNLQDISNKMKEHNVIRKNCVYEKWNKTLKEIKK